MTGLTHLRAIAQGRRPDEDGLLTNSRFACGRSEMSGTEAILAEFAERPFSLEGELLAVETPQNAALVSEHGALVADLYRGRIGRLWRIGDTGGPSGEPAIDVAFDADMSQKRGDVSFRAEDHLSLDPEAAERLLAESRDLVEQLRLEGRLRVRGFIVRAFGDRSGCAALIALFTLGNETQRRAAFSHAVVAIGPEGKTRMIPDKTEPRDWTPRF